MSYYSDVKLITTMKGWKKIQKAVLEADPESILAGASHVREVARHFQLVEFNDIKWYEYERPDVRAFMTAVYALPDEGIPYNYMRIGEDYGDMEESSNWVDDYADMPSLGLKREIEVIL